jgi:hypothetical protein
MTAITDCFKQININLTLAYENGAKWEIHNTSQCDMNDDEDDEEEIFGPSIVFMAHVEDVAGMVSLMEHDFEAHYDDATPSYDTYAEDNNTLGNKVHISDACDNDDLDEFIHGHISTTSKTTKVNMSSEKSTSATPRLSSNSSNNDHVSTSQDHVDML